MRTERGSSCVASARLTWVMSVAFPLLSTASSARAEPPRKLTLSQAIDEALSRSPVVQMAAAAESAADSRVSSTKAMLFPRLRAEGNVLVWDSELAFSLGGPEPLVVRDQVTGAVSVSVAEPLTGLYALTRLIALESAGRDAASAERETARMDTAQRVAYAYFGLLSARAMTEVAAKSLTQIEAQLDRAKSLEQAGVLGRVDVLRLESVRETVRQGHLAVRAGSELAARGLLLAMGSTPDGLVEPVDDFPATPPAFGMTADEARELAATRSELAAASARLEQARGGADVAKAALFPSVVAIGTYQHTEGQGPFQPKNSFFGGAMLTWDVFEWGKTMHQVEEASERARQAELGLAALRDQLRFDVERRLLEAKTAEETLGAAKAGLTAAEEAYRIQSVRFEQGAATTTDVIDAETDLARARSTSATARYGYYLALANAARAVGRLPEVGSKESRP
ncbi:MAG: TolC family protein [Deltaproteobacteria bacterium]|nr:TolC family protein [Deltaproteobacteria bacterium]